MASERAEKGGGRETQLSPEQVLSPGQTPLGSDLVASEGINRGTPADWFGPLNPLAPTAPPEVAGRRMDYQSGYNLTTQPRAYAPISFSTLRSLADGYDLLRTIIETRKDEMERMQWSIAPRDPKAKITTEQQGRIRTLEKFFLRPDRENFWGTWLRMVMEDLLVIDAPAIFKRRTRSGELYSLEVIDGATIKRVIDDYGRTPEAPIVAYQQQLKGFPAINYSTKDLLYRPRNMRAHAVYGYSPVEQILMTVMIGMRRQVFQLAYFTEGNVPESLVTVPDTWTPDQVRQFQDWFDGKLQGNLAERRKMTFVPSGLGKGYMPTKDTELFGEAESWLARVCCYAFSVSPQPFLQMMNRATAETAQEDAAFNGLFPLMSWVKNMVNTILIDEFDETELEFKWQEEQELDPKTESDIIMQYVTNGILTINQGLERLGEDARPEPEFNRPMVKTATGYVPVVETQEEKDAKAAQAAAIGGGIGPDGKPVKPKVGPDGKPLPPDAGAKPGEDGDVAAQDATAPAPKPGDPPPEDEDKSNLAKVHRHGHDVGVKPVERVMQRSPLKVDSEVTFGKTPTDDVREQVMNQAGRTVPNWR